MIEIKQQFEEDIHALLGIDPDEDSEEVKEQRFGSDLIERCETHQEDL